MLAVKIGQQTTGEGQPEQVTRKEPGKSTVQNQAVNTALINVGKQGLKQGIQQYADLTGNYAFSETVNDVLSIGADIGTIAVGGFVGAVFVAGKYAVNITNSVIGLKRETDNILLAQQRAGMLSTEGSRYSR